MYHSRYQYNKIDASIHEITVTIIFYHAFKQWRPSFILIIHKKMSACSPKYQMNNNTCKFLNSRYTEKKWYLQKSVFQTTINWSNQSRRLKIDNKEYQCSCNSIQQKMDTPTHNQIIVKSMLPIRSYLHPVYLSNAFIGHFEKESIIEDM